MSTVECIGYADGLHCDHWFAVDGHCCQCQADNRGSEPRDDGEIPSAAWCGRTGAPGRPITARCGTVSAYKRHVRKSESVDDACREAYNEDQRRRYQARRAAR